MNVIKRRKTVNYLQLNNFPVQKDLDDLAAIGLLTYIMSLPEDWVLHKTQLQSKFTRRKVDSAWKILVENKYAIGFICYINGKKTYHYNVSDIAFSKEDYIEFANETLKEILKETSSISSLKEIPDSPYKFIETPDETTAQNEQYMNEFTTAQIEQYKNYSTLYTVLNVQIQKKYIQRDESLIDEKEIDTNLSNLGNKIVNKEEEKTEEIINNLIMEYMLKGLNKSLCFRVLNEIMKNKNSIDNFGGYFRTCLETTLYRVNIKLGKVKPNPKFEAAIARMQAEGIPFYNWLDAEGEDE